MSTVEELKQYWGPDEFYTGYWTNEEETKFSFMGLMGTYGTLPENLRKRLYSLTRNSESQEAIKEYLCKVAPEYINEGYINWVMLNDNGGQELVYAALAVGEGAMSNG